MSLQSGGFPARVVTAPALEVAHILFMDVVAFSQLPSMETQTDITSELQDIVRATGEFVSAAEKGDLLCRPAGDGMALIFFGDMLAPARCAVEIAHVLKSRRHIRLRMGLHSGPVYVLKDINANSDVSGEGIVTAQRVMDCGDAGHILLSSQVAELLGNAAPWSSYLKDLGLCSVKHGRQIHIFNLCSKEFGNSRVPQRVRDARREARAPSRIPRLLKRLASSTLFLAALGGAAWAIWPHITQLLAARQAQNAAPTGVAAVTRPGAALHHSHKSPNRTIPHAEGRHVASASDPPATGSPESVSQSSAVIPPRLLPGETPVTPDPEDPPATPPEDGSRVFDKTVSISSDGLGLREVRIEYQDVAAKEPETLVDEKYNEGDQIPIHFEYHGERVTVRVFYNQSLAKEWKLTISAPTAPDSAQ